MYIVATPEDVPLRTAGHAPREVGRPGRKDKGSRRRSSELKGGGNVMVLAHDGLLTCLLHLRPAL